MAGKMPGRKPIYHIDIAVIITTLTNVLTSVVSLPLLYPDGNINVTVNTSLTIVCSYGGLSEEPDGYQIQWLKNGLFQGSVYYSDCRVIGALTTTYYNASCPNQNQQNITINVVNLTFHDTRWECGISKPLFISYRSTNSVTIIVNVPVTSVTMPDQTLDPIYVIEGVPVSFVCKTSPCRPKSTVLWYKRGPGSIEEPLNDIIALTYDTTDSNLTVTTSTLSYNASRMDTGSNIYCTATNGFSQTVMSLDQPQINVKYGPTQMNISCISRNTHHVIDNNSVNVINGDTITLMCSANGDPLPDYTWNGTPGRNVTITIEQDNLIYNCTARNALMPDYGTKRNMMDSKKVRIIRQYAPVNEPTIIYTFSNGQLSGKLNSSLSVVENSSFVLTCGNSFSVPMPMYQWNGEINSPTKHLNVTSIKRSSRLDTNGTSYYEYTCKVQNTMINTCGDKRTSIGTLEFTQRVNVLFATVLDIVPDQNVLEGKDVLLTARTIAPGSPTGRYKWIYLNNYTSKPTEIADSLSLTLHNISRKKAGFYAIKATNQIAPTGHMSYSTAVEQTFHLNVFYPSTVSRFQINNHDVNCTVNENSTVFFVCGVDSNPLSFVYINATTYYGKSRLTELGPPKEEVQHTLQIATCYDSGIYRCIGQNNYTSQPVFLDNRLFVRCSPRPRYDVGQNFTFHTALGFSVTLNLTLIAFPEPPAERFKWEKVDGENTTEIINSSHIQINTTGLATTLKIENLKQTDFGQYRLCVNYTYIHYFYISPKGTDVVTTSDFSKAAIGGVVGGVSALVMIVVVVVVFIRRKKGSKDSEEHGYETPQSRTMSSEIENAYNTLHTVEQVDSDPTAYYNLERNPYEDLNREQGQYHEYGTLNISEDTEMNDKRSDDKMYENLRLSPVQLE